MNPTTEQVAQWAREAGFDEHEWRHLRTNKLQDFATRAFTEGCARQAERDAAQLPALIRKGILALPRHTFLSQIGGGVRKFVDTSGRWVEYDLAAALCEPEAMDAAIRANAPKENANV